MIDPFQKYAEEEERRKQIALKALEFFIGQYIPANKETADTFFTTGEVANAIKEHTGVQLSNADVFELMQNMQYKYEALNGLEFYWLLAKEVCNESVI